MELNIRIRRRKAKKEMVPSFKVESLKKKARKTDGEGLRINPWVKPKSNLLPHLKDS